MSMDGKKKQNYKKSNKSSKPKSNKSSGGKSSGGSTKEIEKVVQKVLNKEVEDKMVSNLTVVSAANAPGAGLTSGGLGVLSPISIVMAQGTTESTRIGNKVHAKKMLLRYSIQALPTTEAAGVNPFIGLPFFVKVVIFRHRYNLGDSSPDALVDNGATNQAFDANVDTYFRPFNRDEYEILYSKTHKMQPVRHLSATGYTTAGQDQKFTSWIVRKVPVKVPKTLIFNDTNTQPTNFNAYIGFAVCNIDGSAITSGQTRCTINAESYLYFQDA